MDVVTFVEPHLQPSELMHQGLGLFHDPSDDPQPASVLRVAFGQEWVDPPVAKFVAVRLAFVGAVGVNLVPDRQGAVWPTCSG